MIGGSRIFAAILEDDNVVAWGDNDFGRDLPPVQAQLASGLKKMIGGGGAFAAVLEDYNVVAWGDNTSAVTSPPYKDSWPMASSR